jgi:predicted ATPase
MPEHLQKVVRLAPHTKAPEMPELPVYGDPFFGRSGALSWLGEALRQGARCVTLHGGAGLGKTRLAVEFGWLAWRERLRARIAFVDLSTAQTAGDICEAMRESLHILPEAGGRQDSAAHVGRWLRQSGEWLVILDNAEHLAEALGALVARWLVSAPDVCFLVTSRHTLRVSGEQVLALEPLSLPGPGESPSENEAVRLLAERASKARRGAVELPRDAERLAVLAARLDGIPLALELAAARLEVLSLSRVEEGVRERFGLLRSPTEHGRHGALSEAIGDSWRLLSSAEQAALRQASVFVGAFSMASAEEVLALPGGASVVDALHSLYRKSLLRLRHAHEPEPRFGFYESVREYAQLRLAESGEEEEAERRHAAYFLRRFHVDAEQQDRGFLPAQSEALQARGDLLAILRRALRAGVARVGEAVGACFALIPALQGRLDTALRIEQLDEILALAERAPEIDALVLGWLYKHRGTERMARGLMSEGAADYERALSLADARGAQRLRGIVLRHLGNFYQNRGRETEAETAYRESLALLHAEHDLVQEGVSLSLLGSLSVRRGAFADAERFLQESLARLGDAEQRYYRAFAFHQLGGLYSALGAYAKARDAFSQALALREADGPRAQILGRADLAYADLLEGNLAAARAPFAAAVAFFQQEGEPQYEAYFSLLLGCVAREEGATEEAETLFLKARENFGALRYSREEGLCWAALASLFASQGKREKTLSAVEQARAPLSAVNGGALVPLLEIPGLLLALVGEQAGALDAAQEAAARYASQPSDEVRVTLRILWQHIRAAEAKARAWRICPDGSGFSAPGAAPVSLVKRPLLGQLLAALFLHRRENPGQPLSMDALIRAGWPNDRSSRDAATNRVHVALSTLRKQGLGELLRRTEGGYLLDPGVLALVSESSPDDAERDSHETRENAHPRRARS